MPRWLLFCALFLAPLRHLLAEELALCRVVRHVAPLNLFRSTRYHLRPQRRVRGQHPRVPRQMKSRRRHHRAEARQQIFRHEHHRTSPVSPRLTKRILHTAVVSPREPLKRNRWPRHIAAKSLQSLAITPVHRNSRVDVHAPNLRHERRCQAPFRGPNRLHELLRPLTRTLAEEANILRRRIHADCKC